jgi:hypothetical protein
MLLDMQSCIAKQQRGASAEGVVHNIITLHSCCAATLSDFAFLQLQ